MLSFGVAALFLASILFLGNMHTKQVLEKCTNLIHKQDALHKITKKTPAIDNWNAPVETLSSDFNNTYLSQHKQLFIKPHLVELNIVKTFPDGSYLVQTKTNYFVIKNYPEVLPEDTFLDIDLL